MNMLIAPNSTLFWLCLVLSSCWCARAIQTASWRQLLALQARQHLLLGAIVALTVVWLLSVRVDNAVAFHPLLMTVTTMLFGWSFASIIGGAALLLLAVLQLSPGMAWARFDLANLPVDFCLNVVVPVAWTWGVIELVNRWKFKNPFTFFLGVGFFGAMVGCLLVDLSALALFTLTDSKAQLVVTQDHFWIFLLLAFPEGFMNGTIATAFTVFWPDIVKTYRDEWFLK